LRRRGAAVESPTQIVCRKTAAQSAARPTRGLHARSCQRWRRSPTARRVPLLPPASAGLPSAYRCAHTMVARLAPCEKPRSPSKGPSSARQRCRRERCQRQLASKQRLLQHSGRVLPWMALTVCAMASSMLAYTSPQVTPCARRQGRVTRAA
jgi:hypothetical protein